MKCPTDIQFSKVISERVVGKMKTTAE